MTSRTAVLLSAVVLAAASRWLPHPANFAPMIAMGVFACARLSDRRLALAAPLLALFVSDVGLEVLHRIDPERWPNWGLYHGMWLNYVATVVGGLFGLLARGRGAVVAPTIALLAGSVAFFLLSNFSVWALEDWYPKTLAGLGECYVAGLPFYRGPLGYSLLGDCVYGVILFGGLALAEARFPALRQAEPSPA